MVERKRMVLGINPLLPPIVLVLNEMVLVLDTADRSRRVRPMAGLTIRSEGRQTAKDSSGISGTEDRSSAEWHGTRFPGDRFKLA